MIYIASLLPATGGLALPMFALGAILMALGALVQKFKR